MAETMMRGLLAKKLGLAGDELEPHGVLVMSAGISATAGCAPSPEAVTAMSQRGLDLRRHESQPLSERLVRFADLIVTMTRGHREAILEHWPDAVGRVHVLCRDGSDIADPIGGPLEMYEGCARQIEQQLQRWLDVMDIQPLAEIETTGD
jgi:protein-tyrosine phosphatase